MEIGQQTSPIALPSSDPLRALTDRIRMEYLEMPGLALTRQQAVRLWNMDLGLCEAVLTALIGERFLDQSRDGSLVRRAAR